MEIQKLHLNILLKLGILVVVFTGFGSCLPSPSVVGSCNSNFDENNQSSKSSSGFRKYVVESYFERHESLVDSHFQDFIAQEVLLESCELLQGSSNLVLELGVADRHLIGEGSHRRLSSRIAFNVDLESTPEPFEHSCEAIIVERLPSGVFADPFELQHLLLRGVFTDAAVSGDLNLELPSVASNRSVVEIHMDIGRSALSGQKSGGQINVELPLHARYPPIGEHGFSRVEFGAPDLFMRCRIEGKSHNQSCLFKPVGNIFGVNNTAIVWHVPSGIKQHAGVVSVITFLSAGLSTLLIVLTSIYHTDLRKS